MKKEKCRRKIVAVLVLPPKKVIHPFFFACISINHLIPCNSFQLLLYDNFHCKIIVHSRDD